MKKEYFQGSGESLLVLAEQNFTPLQPEQVWQVTGLQHLCGCVICSNARESEWQRSADLLIINNYSDNGSIIFLSQKYLRICKFSLWFYHKWDIFHC